MATTSVGDLLLRARLDLGGFQRDLARMHAQLQAVPQQIGGATLDVDVDPGDLRREGQQMAQELARGFEADRKRVSDAIGGSVADAVREASAAAEAAAGANAASVQATESLRQANETVTQAMRERASVEQQVAAASASNNAAINAAADSYRQWADASRAASGSVAEISTDIAQVSAAFRAGEASLDDYATAIEHARRQADALGVAGGSKLGREISRAEMALIAAREEADKLAASANRALSGSGAAARSTGLFTRLKDFDKNVRSSTGGVGRLNNAMVTLTRQMAGAHPIAGQLVDVLGTFAIGSAAMVGVLAGLSAVALIANRLTRDWREARREMESARDRLRELARIRALPEGGQSQADVQLARERLISLQRQLQTLRATESDPGVGFEAQAAATLRIQAVRKEMAAVEGEIRAGEGAILDARMEANQRLRAAEASNLAVIIASGQATASELARANQRVLEEQQRLAALAQTEAFMQSAFGMGLSGDQQSQRAESISTIEQLRGAFERLGDMQRQASEDAARALQEEVSSLEAARRLGVLRAGDLGRAVELEQQLRRQVEAGTLSLEQRVRASRQLNQLAEFSLDRRAEVSVPKASVFVAGVELENPDEVRRAYQEQVRETLERDRVRLNMTLTPVTVRSDRNEAERRRVAIQTAQQATEAFNESVQAGTEVMSAFGDLADAAEVLGAGFSDALRAVQTMAEGAQRVRFGQALSEAGQGLLGTLSQVSGYVSIAAGAISFLDSLFEDSEAQRAHAEAVQRATEAINRFKLELSGFRPDTAAGRENVAEAIRRLTEADAGRGLRDSLSWRTREIDGMRVNVRVSPAEQRVFLDEMLRGVGSSLEQVLSIAESIGLDIFDSGGRFVIENFMALAESIGLANEAMVGFANTLSDLQQERSLRDRIMGVERTPEQDRSALFSDLRTLAPQLFEEFFAGVNLADVEAARTATLALFEAFAAGGEEFAALMGNLTRDEFLQWLGQTADSLKTLDETTQSVTSALTSVPQGFRILNLELERFNAMQRKRAEDIAKPPPITAPTAPAPTPPPPPAAETPRRPGSRDPIPEGGGGGPGRERPTYEIADHRTITVQVVQREGEDQETFARRVVEIIERREYEEELTFTGRATGVPYSRR